MLLVFQEEKTQPLECSGEGRQGADSWRCPSLWAGSFKECLQRTPDPHPTQYFPPPSCLDFSFPSPPVLHLMVSCLLGVSKGASWASVPCFLWHPELSEGQYRPSPVGQHSSPFLGKRREHRSSRNCSHVELFHC